MATRHIICFGNDLHGDDGFGSRVYDQLCRLTWPEDVEIFNAGIAGLNALRLLENCSQAVLIDAMTGSGNAGRVSVVRPEDLNVTPRQLTGHGLGIPYLLEALKVVRNPLPEVLIVGVEIDAVKPFSPGLSDKTERAVSQTVQLIQELLPA